MPRFTGSSWTTLGLSALILACSSETADGTGGAGAAAAGTGGVGAAGGALGGSGGGTSGAGGSSAAAGGAGTSGNAGSGGSAPSSGCGSTATPQSGPATIDVAGTQRGYILTLPDGYDSNKAYPLIFAWHPRGGSADGVAGNGFIGGYYGLEQLADGSAIFVAPDGIDDGWANTGGRDIAFLEAMLARFQSELCIDEARIFSTGFSYGGMMSFAIGCAMGDVFRAIAPMSGALYSGCEDGSAPVAVWGSHGRSDEVVPFANGETALQVFLDRNQCSTETVPTDPSPCVSYQGCDAGHPVTWCAFEGGHTPPNFAAESIWSFFSQF